MAADDGSNRTTLKVRLTCAILYAAACMAFVSEMISGELKTFELGVRDVLPFVSELVIAHAVGGATAGFALASGMGRRGWSGAMLALGTAVLVTVLGGLVGGVLTTLPTAIASATPLLQVAIGVGLGAATAPLAIAELPAMGLVWLAIVGVTHAIARLFRRA